MTQPLTSRLERLQETQLDRILGLIDTVVAEATAADSSLVEMCRYHMATGGKRLRALLPMAMAEVLGHDAERVTPFAAACELLHNATLVHDDLQDGDRTRRDQEAVWVRYGQARAINLGDAMLYWTLLLTGRLDHSPAARLRVNDRLVRSTVRVIDGQEREFLLKEAERPSPDDYFRMVQGKTSGLFALPLAGAAELCDAPEALVGALEEAAGHLGVLFQIQDDVLDLYADKGREHRGTDICEGKISALVVHFLSHAPPAEASWLADVLDRPREQVGMDEVERAAAGFRAHGSLQFALDEIDRRRRLATADAVWQDWPEVGRLLDEVAAVFLQPIEAVLAGPR